MRIRARSFAVVAFQPGSARAAASIARRVSAAPNRGTSAIVSPVAGFDTGKTAESSLSVHVPSTNARVRRRSGATVVTAADDIRSDASGPRTVKPEPQVADLQGGSSIFAVKPVFVRFDDVKPFQLADGVSGRPLFGDGAMLNVIEFEPGPPSPSTATPTSSSGSCSAGCRRSSSTASHELGPIEGYVLPGGVEHSAYCGAEGALVLDVFRPVRDDYRERWERTPA